jgi:hypothetical protein
MMLLKGQVTIFIIIGIIILVIVGALIIYLPTLTAPVPSGPRSISLQRCIDESFAKALFEVSARGGYCPYAGTAALLDSPQASALFPHSATVCYGVIRMPAGINGEHLIQTSNTAYGSKVMTSLPAFRILISEAALDYIEQCTNSENLRGTPTVILGDSLSELRIEARASGNERYTTYSSSLAVPFRKMYRIMQEELTKSIRPSNEGNPYGLNHYFSDLHFPSEWNLERAYIGGASTQGHSLFYISTTNNPLPWNERNVHLAVIVQNRYPVVENANVECDEITLIDPDEFERGRETVTWTVSCAGNPATGELEAISGASRRFITLSGGTS